MAKNERNIKLVSKLKIARNASIITVVRIGFTKPFIKLLIFSHYFSTGNFILTIFNANHVAYTNAKSHAICMPNLSKFTAMATKFMSIKFKNIANNRNTAGISNPAYTIFIVVGSFLANSQSGVILLISYSHEETHQYIEENIAEMNKPPNMHNPAIIPPIIGISTLDNREAVGSFAVIIAESSGIIGVKTTANIAAAISDARNAIIPYTAPKTNQSVLKILSSIFIFSP